MFSRMLLLALGLTIASACTGVSLTAIDNLPTPLATSPVAATTLPPAIESPTATAAGLPTPILEIPKEGLIISNALSDVPYRLSFNPQDWLLIDSGRILSRWRLEHRNIPGCIVEPTGGMGLPPGYDTQYQFRDFGNFNWTKITVLKDNKPVFINYSFGGFILPDNSSWGMIFRVEFVQDAQECIRDAEKVLETLQPHVQH